MKLYSQQEEGTTTILAIVLCGVCLLVMFCIVQLGSAARGAVIVQNAADAAALSGAYEVAHTRSSRTCGSARLAAEKNGAILDSCEYTHDEVVVEVHLVSQPSIKAEARAEIT